MTTTTTNTINDPNPDSDSSSACNLTRSSLDLLRKFLELVDPVAATFIPSVHDNITTTSTPSPSSLPIDQWTLLHSSTAATTNPNDQHPASISVRRHPDPNHNTLFSVTSVLPNVNALQFWTLMANSSNRPLWDNASEKIAIKRWFDRELEQQREGQAQEVNQERGSKRKRTEEIARELGSRIEYLSFGSIFMVAKPRDMVLLGADVRLPHTPASAFKQDPSSTSSTQSSPLRLVSTCASIEDPSLPPKKGYQRFHLVVGGFMVEDLSSDPDSPAVRITQVSDLGPASTWLPSSIIKMVAQTLVPRSMSGIRKIAEKIQVPKALFSEPEKVEKFQTKVNGDGEEVQKLKGAGGEWPINRGLPGMLGQGALDFSSEKEEEKTQQVSEEVERGSSIEIRISHSLSASASAREEQERLAREAGENLSKSMRRISMLLARTDSDENTSGNSSELESSVERSDEEEDDSSDDDRREEEDEPKELEDSLDHQDSLYTTSLSRISSKAGLSTDEEVIEQLNDDRENDSISLSNSNSSLLSIQRSTPPSPIANRRPNQGLRLGLGLGVPPSSSSSSSLVQGMLTPPTYGGNLSSSSGNHHEDLSPFSSACSSSSYFSHGTSNDGLGWRGGRRGLNNVLTGGVYAGMGLSDEKFRRATLNLARHVVGGPSSSVHGSEIMSRSQSNQSQATQSINGRSEMSEEGHFSENESSRDAGSSVGGLRESDEDRESRDGNEENEEDEEDYDRTLLSSALRTNSSPSNPPSRLPSLNTLNLSSTQSQTSLKNQSGSSSPTSTTNQPTSSSSPPVSPTRRHAIGFPPGQSPLRKQHDFSPQVGQSSRSLLEELEESRDRRAGMMLAEESSNEGGESRESLEELQQRPLETLEESPDLKESSDTSDSIAFLLAEALGQDLRPPSLRRKPLGTSSKKHHKRSTRAEGSNFSIRSGVGSPSRREMKLEREAKRLSAMLLKGSDQLAMAIAPGARGSNTYGLGSLDDGDEFGVSDIVIEDSEEDEIRIGIVNNIPNLDPNQRPFTSQHLGQFTSDPQFLGPRDGLGLVGKPSAEGRRPSADSSGSSAHTTTGLESSTNNVEGATHGHHPEPTSTSSPSLAASLFSRSRRISENNITVASSPAPPTTTATSILVGSTKEKSSTLQNLHPDSGNFQTLQQQHLPQHQDTITVENANAGGWGSSLAGAPYTLVIGLASLAWATRYSTQHKNQQKEVKEVITPDGSKINVKQRAPSSSAADAVRRVMNGDLERRNTAPPISIDTSLKRTLDSGESRDFVASPISMSTSNPNPDSSNSVQPPSSSSPPIESKKQTDSVFSSTSSNTLNATNSKFGTISGSNYRSSTSAASLKSSSSSVRSRSSKLYGYNGGPAIIPEDGSVDRAFSRGNYAFNDKLHPFPASIGRKELPPIGNGVGAVPLEVREREALEEEESSEQDSNPSAKTNSEDGGTSSYINWISGYLPATGR